MRSIKGIIIGFLLILLGFAVTSYSLIAGGVLAAAGLAAVVIFALPKQTQQPQAEQPPAPAPEPPAPARPAPAAHSASTSRHVITSKLHTRPTSQAVCSGSRKYNAASSILPPSSGMIGSRL